jgi:hypothetical protein
MVVDPTFLLGRLFIFKKLNMHKKMQIFLTQGANWSCELVPLDLQYLDVEHYIAS